MEITKKIAGKRKFRIRKFVGNGCGRIRGKCVQWAHNLKQQGCSLVILIHDLDDNDLPTLRRKIETAFSACPINDKIIVIPVREIEAWLLSDEIAIYTALNLKEKIRKVANPESIVDPKRRLKDIVYVKSGHTKHYINAVHNVKIAAELSVERVKRCKSFLPLHDFLLRSLLKTLKGAKTKAASSV